MYTMQIYFLPKNIHLLELLEQKAANLGPSHMNLALERASKHLKYEETAW